MWMEQNKCGIKHYLCNKPKQVNFFQFIAPFLYKGYSYMFRPLWANMATYNSQNS